MTRPDDPVDFQNDEIGQASFGGYCVVEIVALPPNFNIENHLTMREQAGIFEDKNISLKHLQAISLGVQFTPVFNLLNNPSISLQSVSYFLYILDELGFIIKGINGETFNYNDYKTLTEMFSKYQGDIYFRGHRSKTINFTIINLVQILNNETVEKAMKIAQCEYDEQKIFSQKIEGLNHLDGADW